jgi:GTP-binding protein
VILRADVHTDNLANLFYEPIIKAKNGGHGMGKKMHGRGALPKVVKVPVGTVVWNADEDKTATASGDGPVRKRGPGAEPIIDLTEDGQEVVLCAGGAGGKGNVHFKSSRNRAPVQYTDGEEGEQGYFLFELRTIADAALVGYPNAGKSTLLGAISAAHPKVAAYPFTTLRPSVGVVELDGYRRITIADIPGLIEGAHRNIGLGHEFLRHITRCRYLLFVVDVAGSEGRHPIEDLQSLRREIDLYDPQLSKRPWAIVANKIDVPDARENLEVVRSRFADIDVIPMAAAAGDGIPELKEFLAGWMREVPIPAKVDVEPAGERVPINS